jgi:SWI/SNF-related matrix-associated actin-dependent regulator of chromatin subfamily A3
MQSRERGWALRSPQMDIWKVKPYCQDPNESALVESHLHEGLTYINTVTGETRFSAPLDFRGGILADDMGLGKTLTVISLIASDKDAASGTLPVSITTNKSTLIVVRAPRKFY